MTDKRFKIVRLQLLTAIASTALVAVPGHGQVVEGGVAGPASDGLGDIVVTAQKRQQSLNDVPISITAVGGDVLVSRGISSTSDLAKIVPGLTAQPSAFNIPVYTLRGVGFFDQTLSASPTVAVYSDEVPLPFSAMTKAAALDLERVEVLKGPQGTLFGNNTTGGAINYIAAKPTDTFKAGADASFGRFSTFDVQGFVSGPIAENLNARLAVRTVQGGDWQKSYTRNATLGAVHQTQGRLLLDWNPSDKIKISVNLNGWKDTSDTQAGQFIGGELSVPENVSLGQGTLDYPLAPHNARAADWTDSIKPVKRDDYFLQGSLRIDYELSEAVTLTSISAAMRYKTRSFNDFDAMTRSTADWESFGHINTISQELRLSGSTSNLDWVIGGNYERDRTSDTLISHYYDSTTGLVGPIYIGALPSRDTTVQNIDTYALFGNVEYEVLPNLRIQGGVRYTDSKRTFEGCTYAYPSPDNPSFSPLARAFELLQSIFRSDGAVTPIANDGCITLGPTNEPFPDAIKDTLKEDNISWRAGLNYKTSNRGLIYASASKGYKAGSYPTIAAASYSGFLPVKQESVMTYEVGFKQPLFDRKLQIDAAAFYYDYKDKQIQGRILDPIFGPLAALVQIPKGRIQGVEAALTAVPAPGLTVSLAGTYIDTKIKKFVGYNNAGVLADFAGAEFPYTPKFILISDAQYDFSLSGDLDAFVGGSLTHNSKTSSTFGGDPRLGIRAYTLIDLRAGIKSPDDSWRLELWGRNITNEYYWTNALQTQDAFVRFAGMPVTYGARVSYRF